MSEIRFLNTFLEIELLKRHLKKEMETMAIVEKTLEILIIFFLTVIINICKF